MTVLHALSCWRLGSLPPSLLSARATVVACGAPFVLAFETDQVSVSVPLGADVSLRVLELVEVVLKTLELGLGSNLLPGLVNILLCDTLVLKVSLVDSTSRVVDVLLEQVSSGLVVFRLHLELLQLGGLSKQLVLKILYFLLLDFDLLIQCVDAGALLLDLLISLGLVHFVFVFDTFGVLLELSNPLQVIHLHLFIS